MKLVAIMEPPKDLDGAVKTLCDLGGLAAAEARMRLAPEPPMLVAHLESDKAIALAAGLRQAGLAALAVESAVPTDADRKVARIFALEDKALTFTPRDGAPLSIPYDQMAMVLRGVRVTVETTSHSETQKSFSLGRALATQGLVSSKTSQREVRNINEELEHFVLVYGPEGKCGAIYDSRAAFGCLGPKVQPTKLGNIQYVADELKRRAPRAIHDSRLLRLGRRPLPFLVGKEMHMGVGNVTATRTGGSSVVDVLAEVMLRASLAGMLGAPR